MLHLYTCAMCVMAIVTVLQGEYACWWWVIFTQGKIYIAAQLNEAQHNVARESVPMC